MLSLVWRRGNAAGGEVDVGVGEGGAGVGVDEAGAVVDMGEVSEDVGVEKKRRQMVK